jgi:FkbM family methyltransferase
MPGRLKGAVRRCAAAVGYQISRTRDHPGAAADARPVGDRMLFLEDLKARGFNPSRIVDVGAHSAEWSLMARSRWPDAWFTLIEPQAEMKPNLDDFCRHPRARWIQAGAGREVGTSVLAIDPDPTSSTFAYTEEEAEQAGLRERRAVPLVTLDSVWAESGEPTPELVKLDVEGLELDVLRGAETFLGSTELFLVEVSFFRWSSNWPSIVDVVDFMAEWGYVPYDLCWFLRRPLDGALALADVAFALEEGFLRSSNDWG